MLTALKFGDYNNLFLLCNKNIYFSVLCDSQKLVSLKAMSRSCFCFSRCAEVGFVLGDVQKLFLHYAMSRRSTSKVRVAQGGMTLPTPSAP